jgi:redox-sensing transcriptional repressor
MRYHKISDETIKRLPLYVRHLQFLAENGKRNICSSEFTRDLGVNPAQVRRDLSLFGNFGKPGVGYDVKKLLGQLRSILKLRKVNKTALVGVGDLGSALLGYAGFSRLSFEIVAAFDSDAKKIGKVRNNVIVEHVSGLNTLKQRGIKLAIIAVPAMVAQKVVDSLIEAGILGILNFAACHLTVPKKVMVINIDIALDFARLPYYMPADAVENNKKNDTLKFNNNVLLERTGFNG